MTVINNPPAQTSDSGGGMGFFLGIVVFIVFILFLIYYVFPQFTGSQKGTQINVPDKINVNLNQK